jgi:NAD(P)-dependent dehydrogenase (short-subunit alcohol dehydrogenase family)
VSRSGNFAAGNPAASPAHGELAEAAGRNRAVLVTGASTGIGRSITERLASRGFLVYAGARKDSDLEALDALSGVQAVALDVTRLSDIESTHAMIEGAGRGLFALVNNAGILTSGPVVSTSLDELASTMSVNAYGPWRMVQAFAGLLTTAGGRIVNIGSINGVAINPELSAYCMSKHAVEAFTDVLAEEMCLVGVEVSVVEPGSFRSNLVQNQLVRTGSGAAYLEYVARAADPDIVAAAVESALLDPAPKRRYLCAPNADEARFAIESLLQRLVEMNHQHPFSCSRDDLIALLDAALDRLRQGNRFPREWPEG